MRRLDLIRFTLRHFWRTNLGVALGVALSSMVITGALLVGDSIRGSLQGIASSRIGAIETVMQTHDRYFKDDLDVRMFTEAGLAAALLHVHGSVVAQETSHRSNHVNVYGVDSRFWALSPSGESVPLDNRSIAVGHPLATRLGLSVGDTIIVRVPKPGLLPAGTSLAGSREDTIALRGKVSVILEDDRFGRFSLRNEHASPESVFVARDWLQERLDRQDSANLLLSREHADVSDARLRSVLEVDDLQLRALASSSNVVASHRVYMDSRWSQTARQAFPMAPQVMTWFVDQLAHDERVSPYSMISGVRGQLIPSDLRDDEIVINKWLAGDLKAKRGDEIEISYVTTHDGISLSTNSPAMSCAVLAIVSCSCRTSSKSRRSTGMNRLFGRWALSSCLI